ncbi:FAD-binding oxidoreductase [Myxacorys almedinensis]|uniref:FAD-binding protein n=1 Tax=Myxacorys almedinensis A TaxID=2690445 RepID=A0A8J8CKA5_9CYAN|nr:FAD-binding oxidoreductase [Myxacorys almedinensis]NDJ19668.1 FAD-binding protein [Myxacorys almedinensis A]
MNAVAQSLEQLVSPTGWLAWDAVAAPRQQAILRALRPGVQPAYLVYPHTQAELASVMAFAHQKRWQVLPCGRGSKLHWGGLVAGATLVISTERLNRLIDHAIGDLTVTAEAGLSFAEVQQHVGKAGQFLAIDPTVGSSATGATLGGIVATGDTGSWRHRYHSVRDMLLGITFVRSDGQLVKAGGRVVKNVAGYDLMKVLTGSYGTLGIITQVTFRVFPLPSASRTVVLTGQADAPGTKRTFDQIAKALQALLSSALTPTAVDLQLEQGLRLVVRFQSLSESVELQATRLNEIASALGLSTSSCANHVEQALWQTSKDLMDKASQEHVVLCKIGVKPSNAVEALFQMERLMPNATAVIHGGSGLGQMAIEGVRSTQIQEMRSRLQSLGGYLSILQAPPDLKQRIDVWGYSGNALPLMKQLKQHFDPDQRLSPQRFVSGI